MVNGPAPPFFGWDSCRRTGWEKSTDEEALRQGGGAPLSFLKRNELFGNQVVAVVLGNLLQLAQGGDLDARVEDDFADGDGEGVEVGREGGVVEVEVGVGGHEKTSFGMR